ncbi:INCENP_ARK-bind domain-containing protein [Mucor velutinosus]|uniref:INCENP_ARK-bind domain-containing protein n=1 Tax=Mucor velutinosus TaxID=708070 RepID=A0AAN7HLQ3_9FUNG|nr:INCENP_ARK-bind domain-containing protein [Mucor velutinosus]
MAFFQSDLDPIYLRENHRQVLFSKQQSSSQIDQQHLQQQPSLFITSSTRVFQHLFKTSPDEKKPKTATTDPMNRLVSFHL